MRQHRLGVPKNNNMLQRRLEFFSEASVRNKYKSDHSVFSLTIVCIWLSNGAGRLSV